MQADVTARKRQSRHWKLIMRLENTAFKKAEILTAAIVKDSAGLSAAPVRRGSVWYVYSGSGLQLRSLIERDREVVGELETNISRLSRTQPFLEWGRLGYPVVPRAKLIILTATPQGEILNPAQRIRVEGFKHMTTAGARQICRANSFLQEHLGAKCDRNSLTGTKMFAVMLNSFEVARLVETAQLP
jgi:hypothetical protein